MGRAVVQTISALDGGPAVPKPSAYLLFDGKVVPAWAIRLFVLALIVPVLMATIDGMARARRRGHPILRWVGWVLCGALAFVPALALVLAAKLVGADPRFAAGSGGRRRVPPHGSGIAILAVLACTIVLCLLVVRPILIRAAGLGTAGLVGPEAAPGAAAGLLLVLCAVTLAIWLSNPFAAALLVPALHFWLWVVAPDLRLRRAVSFALLVGGFVAPALVIAYYALVLGLDPLGWHGTGAAGRRRSHRSARGARVEHRAGLRAQPVADYPAFGAAGSGGGAAGDDPRADHLRRPGVAWGHEVRASPVSPDVAGTEIFAVA